MRYGELLRAAGVMPDAAADLDVLITDVTDDSRAVTPGALFVALPGLTCDGADYIAQARARGAAAVLRPPHEAAVVFAKLCAVFFAPAPAHLAAITGTDGKTSTAEFVRRLLALAGVKAASVGTLGTIIDDQRVVGTHTTPAARALHVSLAAAARAGVRHAVLEASSHGLDRRRLDGLRFDVGVFTGLSRDHLDYHGTLQAYAAAKQRLFVDLLHPAAAAVLKADDPLTAAFADAARAASPSICVQTFASHAHTPTASGLTATLHLHEATHRVDLPLIGAFQADNVAAALLTVARLLQTPVETLLPLLADLTPIPGRMERAGTTATGAPVFVDYAHTPDALTKALQALRPHVHGRLIVVFGCGGNRDIGKRSAMGAAAASGADAVIVTDDNPRHEDPAAIRAQVLQGAPDAENIADRGDAIARALQLAQGADAVLIAGKGHETEQIYDDRVIPFDDRAVVRMLTGG